MVLLGWTRLEKKIARCIPTERLIGHTVAKRKCLMPATFTTHLNLFHCLTNNIQQNNLNLCHSKNSIFRASIRSAAKQSPNPFVLLALKN